MAFFVSNSIVDAYCLDVLGDEAKTRYGEVRLWCAVSWGGGSVLMGVITDHYGFSYNFILYGALAFVSLLVIACKVPQRTRSEKENTTPPLWGDLWRGIGNATTMLFFIEVLIFGAAMGVVERGLLFVYLLRLGASTTLCGLTVGVTVILELPIFWYSGKLLRVLGHDALMCIALFAYSIRANGYAFLTHDTVWWVLALELLHGLTFACMWIAAVDRSKELVSVEWGSTIQMLLGLFKDVLGGGAAALGGGYVMKNYGGAILYRVAGCVTAGVLVLHVLVVLSVRCCGCGCGCGCCSQGGEGRRRRQGEKQGLLHADMLRGADSRARWAGGGDGDERAARGVAHGVGNGVGNGVAGTPPRTHAAGSVN